MRYDAILFLLVLVAVLILAAFNLNYQKVEYTVEGCEKGWFSLQSMSVEYDERTGTLTAYVLVNCCGVNVTVEKKGSIYRVVEKQYGELCRCVCMNRVKILNVQKDAEIEFIDKGGNRFILTPVANFCGQSTYGECKSDKDCVKSGCSNQVCQSKYEEPVITTCEWKECYNYRSFGVDCKCIDERCQWEKE